mmetsp:Transcript_2925/g.6929  ORF Transcript_2925/g.6929 Transcript_2925/m.6929 type:complete len:273 (-) Transcript_2925:138-956(-)
MVATVLVLAVVGAAAAERAAVATAKAKKLDALINNAAVADGSNGTTVDGHGALMQVNHLSPTLLTLLLLDAVDDDGRIVFVSSQMLGAAVSLATWRANPTLLGWSDVLGTPYGTSKFANALTARELARRLTATAAAARTTTPTVAATHPGFIKTDLVRELRARSWLSRDVVATAMKAVVQVAHEVVAMGPRQGAMNTLMVASRHDGVAHATAHGAFFDAAFVQPPRVLLNATMRAELDDTQAWLWQRTVRDIGLTRAERESSAVLRRVLAAE